MLFARSNASSGVRNVITLNTGSKISFEATRCVPPVGPAEADSLSPVTHHGAIVQGQRKRKNLFPLVAVFVTVN